MKFIYNLYYSILFKIKDPKKVLTHPRYDLHIKYGFSVGDRHYYRLLHDYDIPENRYRFLQTYYDDATRKVSASDIEEFCNTTISLLDKGKKTEAGALQLELKHRVKEWIFEPTTLFKYASVLYFDLQENILDYDIQYNNDKIVNWSKKKSVLRLFLKELMENANSLLELSSEDFTHYLSQLQEKIDQQQKSVIKEGQSNSSKSIDVMI